MADKRLKLVSNAPIYKDVRSLLNEILEVTPEFPRQYKYTIGGEMQKLAVSLLSGAAAAYMDKANRLAHLSKFRYEFETLRTLVRIAGEKRWIKGIARHAQIIELMEAIGKQSTAWKNSISLDSE
ncbi:four helix bundle protein [Prevotella brevis]|nr:four helix bundle protein [Xylanibacter brevis]